MDTLFEVGGKILMVIIASIIGGAIGGTTGYFFWMWRKKRTIVNQNKGE